MKPLLRLILGRKGWLSNLESIAGVIMGVMAILVIQRFGYTLSEEYVVGILAGGVGLGNQLFGNLDAFKRWDKIIFPDQPHEGPGTSDSLDDARK